MLPRISSLWSPVGGGAMHFLELYGAYQGKAQFHVMVWTESGYAQVVEVK